MSRTFSLALRRAALPDASESPLSCHLTTSSALFPWRVSESVVAMMNREQIQYSENRILSIFTDICAGVNSMHSAALPIAHFDVKVSARSLARTHPRVAGSYSPPPPLLSLPFSSRTSFTTKRTCSNCATSAAP